jgi:hypothetical protein
MANRIEAAQAIAEMINVDDNHGARLWTKENAVRLYLKFNTQAKKGWIDNGFVAFLPDGTIEVNANRNASVVKDAVRQYQSTQSIAPAQTAKAPTEIPGVDEEGNDWRVRDVAGDERGY